MTKEEVISWIESISEEAREKADGIVPCNTEIACSIAIQALLQPRVIFCKDCIFQGTSACPMSLPGCVFTAPDNWFCANAVPRINEEK